MPKTYQPIGVGMTPCKTKFGEEVRDRRITLGLTQYDVALKSGLSQAYVSKLEVKDQKYIDNKTLKGLSKALRIDSEVLSKKVLVKSTYVPRTALGKFILERCQEINLPHADFAKRMGMTNRQARLFIIKKYPSTHYKRIKLLAKALELESIAFFPLIEHTKKECKTKFGQFIRDRRRELGIDIASLARELGVSRQYMDIVETEKEGLSTNNGMIEKLSFALKVDANVLKAFCPKRRLKIIKTSNLLGNFIYQERVRFGSTLKDFSEKCGVSTTTISKIERGIFIPSHKILKRISDGLGREIPAELWPQKKSQILL